MRYVALRPHREHPRRWPVGAVRPDRGVGHPRADYLAAAAAGYFYRNRGWRRSRHLFSHVRVGWSPRVGWSVGVWYVNTRRARPVRPRRRSRRTHPAGRPGWVRRVGGLTYLCGVARTWARPGSAWKWFRLPGLFTGTVDTLAAHLVYRLRGRAEARVKSIALPALRLTQRMPHVRGAHVRCHGRFTRRQRTTRAAHSWGRPGRTHLAARVGHARVVRALRFGSVGVTLLVNYGDG